jgi:hypothetical protein
MARYQVVVTRPFVYDGRQVVAGEVLELTATEALRQTYAQRVTWNTHRPRPVPARKKKRRPAPEVA